MLTSILQIVEVVVASLLILSILIQHRASGLTATFGGAGATFVQRRGAEKVIYKASIWLSILFFGIAIALWYV